ncbi:MAG: hypothetical protein Q8P54_03210 [bacterium]|nr:hypothetical protein [bacterium]
MMESYRNQEWLENLLADIWYKHFFDIPQHNDVIIRYGRKAKRRLGSINRHHKDQTITIITVNRLFIDPQIPEYVVRATIFHEMTHYAHGFNSPLNQKQRHPHSGGIIKKEFAERDQEELYQKQKKWLKKNWPNILKRYF